MRAISFIATYKNGKKAQVGWYCPKNADMVPSSFTRDELTILVDRFKAELNDRDTKTADVTILVQQSYSLTRLPWFTVTMKHNKHLLDSKRLFAKLNHILTFNY